MPTLETQLFGLRNRNCSYFADSGATAILVVEPELPIFCRLWRHCHFGCGTGTALILLTLEPQIFWLKNKNRPYFAAAVLEPQLFFLWNRNCPYFSYCGDAAILVAEPEPLLFCRLWRRCHFGCGTGTALILLTLETPPFWLRNRNCPYFSDSGDAAILVAEPELPLFCRRWRRPRLLLCSKHNLGTVV